MWERIVKCLGKGSGPTGVSCGIKMSDLKSRVPLNQMKQFKRFAKKREEYNNRMLKFPAEMPKIDWDYYRQNVPEDKVEWVNKFADKYDNLDSMFANRHSLIDTSKYFCEIDEQIKEVQKEVDEFKKKSNERIAKLQQQIDTLKPLKPYTEMTMEEFCLTRPDLAPDFINKPTFWPHIPEEQKPGPAEPDAHHEDPENPDGSKNKPKSEGDKPGPKKPPPKTPPAGAAPADGKAPAPPASDAKKELPKEEKASEGDGTSVASKAVDLAMQLADKAVLACQMIVQKINDKRKGGTGKSAPDEKSVEPIAKQPKPVDEDAFHSRETVSNICNKTIIRGEDTKEADVKPHHVNLDNEGETISASQLICVKEEKELDKEEQICERAEKTVKESPCKQEPICDEEKAEELVCEVDEEEEIECKPDPKCEEGKKVKDICNLDPPCEEKDKKGSEICQKLVKDGDCGETSPTTSKPKAIHDVGTLPIARVNEPVCTLTDKCQDVNLEEVAYASMSKQQTELERFQEIKLINESFDLARRQIMEPQKESQMPMKFPVGDDGDAKAKTSKLAPFLLDQVVKKFKPKSAQDVISFKDIHNVVRFVFEMATSADKLLSDAKEILDRAQAVPGGRKQEMESAYLKATQKVNQAMEEAQMALGTARKLAEESGLDKDAIALIEKNIMLAQLLITRAMAMKEEISKLLSDLSLL